MGDEIDDLLDSVGAGAGPGHDVDSLLDSVGARQLAPGPGVAEVQVRVDGRGRPVRVDRGVSHQYVMEPQQITAGQGDVEDYAPESPAPKPVKAPLPHRDPSEGEAGRWATLAAEATPLGPVVNATRAALGDGPRMPTMDDVARVYRRWIGDVGYGDAPVEGRMVSGGEALGQGILDAFPDKAPTGDDPIAQEMRARHSANVDAARRAAEQHPGFHAAGTMAGAATMGAPNAASVPGRVLQAEIGGGLVGAGAARQEGAAPDQEAMAALEGAGGGVVGQGLVEGLGASARALATRQRQLQAHADRLRVLTAMGATGGTTANPAIIRDAERVPGGVAEMARVMREQGMAPMIGTTAGLAEQATNRAERSREAIRDMIEAVDDRGARVSLSGFADRLGQAADDLGRRPEREAVAEALRARAQDYPARLGDDVSMREAQQLVSDLGELGNYGRNGQQLPLPAAQDAARTATGAMRDEMDAAAGRAFADRGVPQALQGPYRDLLRGTNDDAVQAYRSLRRTNQVSRIVGERAIESAARGDKNRLFGLTTQNVANTAANLGAGPVGAAAAGIGTRLLQGTGASVRATAAEGIAGLARMMQRNPQLLRPYTGRLLPAIRNGASALVAEHSVLMQNDPRYRALMMGTPPDEIQQEQGQ